MKKFNYQRILGIFLILVMSALGCLSVNAQESINFMPGEVIVGLKEQYLGSSLEELFLDLDIEKIESLYAGLYEIFKNDPNVAPDKLENLRVKSKKVFVITLVDKSKESVLGAIESLANNPYVEYAEPNYIVTLPPSSPSPPNLSTADDWACEGITEAYSKGFIPDNLQDNYTDIIARQEFCRMAVKWVEYASGKSIDTILSERGLSRDLDAFTDTSDPDILAAFALGITNGVGGNRFDPYGQFTREQAAVMIMNTCRAIGVDVTNPPLSGFADMENASNWVRDGINFVRASGIMKGVGGNNFNPTGTYTIQESIVTFNNIDYKTLLRK